MFLQDGQKIVRRPLGGLPAELAVGLGEQRDTLAAGADDDRRPRRASSKLALEVVDLIRGPLLFTVCVPNPCRSVFLRLHRPHRPHPGPMRTVRTVRTQIFRP